MVRGKNKRVEKEKKRACITANGKVHTPVPPQWAVIVRMTSWHEAFSKINPALTSAEQSRSDTIPNFRSQPP